MKKSRFITTILVTFAVLMFITGSALASEISVTKNIKDPKPYYLPGSTVSFVMTVANPASNTVTNTIKNVWDTLPDSTVIWFIKEGVDAPLVQAPGASKEFTYDYVIPLTLSGTQVNIFEASGRDSIGNGVKGYVEANFLVVEPKVSIIKYVWDGDSWEDANTITGPHLLGPGDVKFRVVVTNDGDVPLELTVKDDMVGSLTLNDMSLDPKETGYVEYTAAWKKGQQTNIATVTTQFTGVEDSDPANYFGSDPAVSIIKYVWDGAEWQDANSITGPHLFGPDDVKFKVVVTNTGNEPLELTVNDDKVGPLTLDDMSLAPTESGYVEYKNLWKAGQQTNIATVTTQYKGIEDSDPANYYGSAPAVSIIKYVWDGDSWEDANTITGPHLFGPDDVKFKVVVTNTGNEPLELTVNDDKVGVLILNDMSLAPTESGYVEYKDLWKAGQQTNIATVTTQYKGVEDSDPANYYGSAPAVSIIKYVWDGDSWEDANTITGPLLFGPDDVKFRVEVKNEGNEPLELKVSDDKVGALILNDMSLAVGESGYVEYKDIWKAGQQTNIATVTTQYKGVEDSDPANYFGVKPGINIVKYVWDGEAWDDANAATGPTLLIGSEVKWQYVVTNTGNVPLTAIEVTDNMGVTPIYKSGDDVVVGVLELGEKWIFEATGTVIAGQYTNIGKACGYYEKFMVCDDDPANYFGSMDYTGLTPGFWKNHTEEGYWFCYLPSDYITVMFGETTKYYGLGGLTLLQTLSRTIKRTESNAPGILLRAAVAAVLNACHPEINYAMSKEDIISEVQDALNGGDYSEMLMLAEKLAGYNEMEGVEVTKP